MTRRPSWPSARFTLPVASRERYLIPIHRQRNKDSERLIHSARASWREKVALNPTRGPGRAVGRVVPAGGLREPFHLLHRPPCSGPLAHRAGAASPAAPHAEGRGSAGSRAYKVKVDLPKKLPGRRPVPRGGDTGISWEGPGDCPERGKWLLLGKGRSS